MAPQQANDELPLPQNIIDSNNNVREALEKGLDAVKLQENWDYLQINCAMYINSDMPGVASQSQPNTKPLRQAFSKTHALLNTFTWAIAATRRAVLMSVAYQTSLVLAVSASHVSYESCCVMVS